MVYGRCLKTAVSGILFAVSAASADTIQQIGSYSGWDSVEWNAIGGLNDAADTSLDGRLDFIGDSADAGGYWGIHDDYVFFRMRLNFASVTADPFHDSHFVLIDAVGYGDDGGLPDYGFVWDSQSNSSDNHGLEMSILDSKNSGTTWDSIKMDDIDGLSGQKGTVDINGDGRDTDGYVQSVDGVATENLGTTTFLDFAVSLSYLTNQVSALTENSSWRVQFGSIDNSNDHNAIDADWAGDIDLTSSVSESGWSETIAIPEPAAAGLILIFGGGILITKRIFGR
ncbi:hypothetical protein [Pontiella sp.]|uniref:hypothetical protein n=1 Tax=Pontiella sp. TaxID=2837462 RepID=UPI00356A9EEA